MPSGCIAARQVKFVMPFNNPIVKAKEAPVEETLYLLKRTEYFVYVVESRSMTPSVPYGDNFSPMSRTCITWVSKNSCKMTIHTGIKFFKSPMIKSIIKSEGAKGLAKGAQDIVATLKTEIDAVLAKEGGARTVAAIGGAAAGNGKADGDTTLVQPTFTTKTSSTVITTSAPAAAAEESILPFDLSKSFWAQWGMVGLLGLLLFMQMLRGFTGGSRSVGRGGEQCGVQKMFLTECLLDPVATDWGSELSGKGKGLGIAHEISMHAYITSHYPGPHPRLLNETAEAPWRKRNVAIASTESTPSSSTKEASSTSNHHHHHHHHPSIRPNPGYQSSRARGFFERLETLQAEVEAAREDALRSLRWLEELEKGLLWAGYWNWVADGIREINGEKRCLGAVGEAVGGCEGMRKLQGELEGWK
ncbi:Protein Aster-A [Blyttiomyces sp. JEL0837]|nr:Protein Aster-A [Blyttiomyces sp. JEL0837]